MDNTCIGLQQFIANTNSSLTQCTRDSACTMVTCNTLDSNFQMMVESSKITLLPCTDPPSIQLAVMGPIVTFTTVLDSDAEVHLIEVPMLTAMMEVAIVNVSLLVKVDPSVEGEIEIEVTSM